MTPTEHDLTHILVEVAIKQLHQTVHMFVELFNILIQTLKLFYQILQTITQL